MRISLKTMKPPYRPASPGGEVNEASDNDSLILGSSGHNFKTFGGKPLTKQLMG